MKVSTYGRYLVDQQDRPWRIQAYAAWMISCLASAAQLDAYLTTRAAQGFNSFYLSAVVHPGGYRDAPHAPNNREGNPPFGKLGDFSTAGATPESERYWRWSLWQPRGGVNRCVPLIDRMPFQEVSF